MSGSGQRSSHVLLDHENASLARINVTLQDVRFFKRCRKLLQRDFQRIPSLSYKIIHLPRAVEDSVTAFLARGKVMMHGLSIPRLNSIDDRAKNRL